MGEVGSAGRGLLGGLEEVELTDGDCADGFGAGGGGGFFIAMDLWLES